MNDSVTNAESLTEIEQGNATHCVDGSHLHDFVCRQFGVAALLAATIAAFASSVEQVSCLRAQKEMFGTNARRVVAVVSDHEAFGKVAEVKNPDGF